MRKKNLFAMAFVVVLAFSAVSCSNELEEGTDPNPNEVVEGEKTWAVLNFKIAEGNASRAAAETEDGTEEENKVSRIDVYVFNQEDVLEMKVEDIKPTKVEGSNQYLAPATPVEATSGTKTFFAVLNQTGTIQATAGTTTMADFLKNSLRAESYRAMTEQTFKTENGFLMSGRKDGVTLHSGISKNAAESAAAGSDPDQKAANNVVEMKVDRAVAKLDLKLAAGGTDVKKEGNTIATLKDVTYKANNIAKDSYYFKQKADDNGVYPTPNYQTGYDADKWYDMKGEAGNEPYVGTGTTLYLTPNTHELGKALMGNTTYVLVRGLYAPKANSVVKEYAVTSGKGDFVLDGTFAPSSTGTGSKYFAIFSNNYDVVFPALPGDKDLLKKDNITLPNFTADVKAQLQQLVAKRIAGDYYLGKGVSLDEITVVADEDAYTALATDGAPAKTESHYYAYLKPLTYITNAANATTDPSGSKIVNKEGCYEVVMKRWSKVIAGTGSIEDASFTLSPLSITVYDVEKTTDAATNEYGLVTYFRVNVNSEAGGNYQKGHPMYYSVIRNFSYHITVNGVANIGGNTLDNTDLPTDEEQNKPVDEVKTYMQTSIAINQWVKSDMGVTLK